jgi:hypothetical protein
MNVKAPGARRRPLRGPGLSRLANGDRVGALVAVLLLGIGAVGPGAAGAGPEKARVGGVHYLKLRAAPDFGAPETGVLAAGDTVDVLEVAGRWARVELADGTQGYVSRKYLLTTAGDAAAEPAPATLARTPPDTAGAEPAASSTMAPPAPTMAQPSPTVAPPSPTVAPPAPPATRPRRRDPLCTKADLEALREHLQTLAAGQDRLTALARPADTAPAGNGDRSVPRPPALVWLAAAFAIGLLTGRAVGRRDRSRRHRIRV